MSHAPRSTTVPASGRDFVEENRAHRQEAMFHVVMAFVVAVAETLALYLGLSLAYQTPPLDSCLGEASDANLPYLAAVFLSRSFLQPLNVIVFAFAANTLAIRLLLMPRELHAFSHAYFAGIPTNPQGGLSIDEDARSIPLVNVQQIAREYTGSLPILVRRIETGSRRLAEGGGAGEVQEVMKALSDVERDSLESRFTLVRYLTWLIPTIGFLGTVIGIGLAITQFAGVISQFGGTAEDFQQRLQENLSGVASSLGVAFDTTMLALLLSAFLVALTSVVQTREEGLLLSVDEFCLRSFVSRISVPDANARTLMQVAMGLTSLAQGVASVAQQATAKDEQQDMTHRDLAGLIAGQTEQIKEAIVQSGRAGHPVGVFPAGTQQPPQVSKGRK